MTWRPGRNLPRFLGWTLLGSLVLLVWPQMIALAPVVLLAAAAGLVVDYRFLKAHRSSLSITRSMPRTVARGETFQIVWTIAATKPLPLEGEWRDEIPAAAAPRFVSRSFTLGPSRSVAEFQADFSIPIRGEHFFGPLWLRLSGPCRLLEVHWPAPDVSAVKVLPETYASRHDLARDAAAEFRLLDKLAQARQQGAGTEFLSLSEFREGDDPRRIDWRSSARLRRPILRKHQVEKHRDVMVLIDCGRLMGGDAGQGSKLDCAIDAGLMIASAALHCGDRCGIALFDDQVVGYLPPVTGLSSLRSIVHQVYAAQSRWRESDFSRLFAVLRQRQQKRSFIVLLSDILDLQTTDRFRGALGQLARAHLVLFAALQTPKLSEVIRRPIRELFDASQQAVAFELLRQREQALHSLRRGAVHVLDAPPADLTAPLINRFLELRLNQLN